MSDKTGGSAAIGYDWRANSPHPDAIDPYAGPEPECPEPDLWTPEQVALMREVLGELERLSEATSGHGAYGTGQRGIVPENIQHTFEEASSRANVQLTITEATATVIESVTRRLADAGLRTGMLNLHSYNGVETAQHGRNLIGTTAIADLPADVVAYADYHFLRGLPGQSTAALRSARGEPAGSVLAGPRARSYYNNVTDPEHDRSVVIDADMVRSAIGNPDVSLDDIISVLSDDAGYNALADVIRQAADQQGLPPSALQAILSSEWRKEHPR